MKTRRVHLESRDLIKAPRREIYRIITDFEGLPRHFPAVARSARYISRSGDDFVVEAQTRAFLGSQTFLVRMEGRLTPPQGFVSTNTSALGVEHETFTMEETAAGTEIHYVNDVEITHRFFRVFSFLIKGVALWYWRRAVFGRLRHLLEGQP